MIFNYLNYLFLGDSGSYILGLFIGYLLVTIYNNYPTLSPYYIILLLWYPCYEILFSMIRKCSYKKSPTNPDNKHLHQLIYIYIKNKFKISNNLSNNFSSLIINLYNLFVFILASLDYKNTQYLIFLISINIAVYTFIYYRLFKLR